MPKQKQTPTDTAAASKSALETAAEVIGSTIGKIAKTTGVANAQPEVEPRPAKPGKLSPKNKTRLPRKEKKKASKQAGSVRGKR